MFILLLWGISMIVGTEILILIILFTSLFAIYKYVLRPLQFWLKQGVKQKGVFHCFSVSWLSLFKRQSPDTFGKNLYNEFPDTRYSGCYQFGSPALTLRDPELIKQVTIKDFDHFYARRTYIPEDIEPLFGKSLPSLNGEKWRNMRSTLSPAFTSSKMKGMFLLIKECAENFTNHFLKKDLDVVSVQFKEISGRFASDVVATCAFGITVDSLENQNNNFYTTGRSITNLTKFSNLIKFSGFLLAPKLYRLFKIKFADEQETAFFKNLVDDSVRMREEKGVIRPDVIHLLMQTRQGVKTEDESTNYKTEYATVEEMKTEKGKRLTDITNEDITAQMFIFFFAGFESVSTLICFTAYELGVNQDIQDKLRVEIYETNKTCNGTLTYEALVHMKYLDMVISEVLRKWPSLPIGERVCTKPYTIQPSSPEESPVHLEEGHLLLIPIFGLHHDPKYFPDPERFDPERFSDENKGKIFPYTYIPFGSGPRNCIASRLALLETKILFYNILLKFEIVPVEKTCIPVKLVKSPALILIENGCTLGIKRIKS